LKLPLDIICPSHGVIWRDKPVQIVEKYLTWASGYKEKQTTVVYDTVWNGTQVMAESVAQGIQSADSEVNLELLHVSKTDKNDIIAATFNPKAILLGSPTINKGILTSTANLLEELRGLSFKGKKAAVFVSYGWSGESVGVLKESLEKCGFTLLAARNR
jgi:flavorubredoxin